MARQRRTAQLRHNVRVRHQDCRRVLGPLRSTAPRRILLQLLGKEFVDAFWIVHRLGSPNFLYIPFLAQHSASGLTPELKVHWAQMKLSRSQLKSILFWSAVPLVLASFICHSAETPLSGN